MAKAKKAVKHVGFKGASASVQAKNPGLSKQAANAIIAKGAMSASPAAKARNPRLKKVGAKKAGRKGK